MQNFIQQGLTDISNLATDVRVKLTEGKIEQPASQRSTMQSMTEVQGNEENILSNASIDQGGFSSIQDKKSGSLEHLSTVLKRPFLKRQSYRRKLQKGLKKGKKAMKQAPKGQGKVERFFREKAQSLRFGAKKLMKQAPAKELEGEPKANKFVLEFSASQWNSGDRRSYLKRQTLRKRLAKPQQKKPVLSAARSQKLYRQRAGYIRKGARQVLNQFPLGAQGKGTGSAEAKPQEFLLQFSSNEWNGGYFKARKQADESNPKKWVIEIPASEWNLRSGEAARQRAGFLMSRAQGFMKQASLSAGGVQKGAQRLYRRAANGLRQFFGGKAQK